MPRKNSCHSASVLKDSALSKCSISQSINSISAHENHHNLMFDLLFEKSKTSQRGSYLTKRLCLSDKDMSCGFPDGGFVDLVLSLHFGSTSLLVLLKSKCAAV